jgi:hypothetical protein
MRMPLSAGGVATVVASNQDEPGTIVVDGSAVYWTNSTAIMKADLDGSRLTVVASEQSRAGEIVVDATSVYWTTGGKDGVVMKATPK